MNLPTEYIEKFAECYCNRLLDRRISYYIHDKDNHSRANTVHSGIIWSREAVKQLNSIDFRNNHDLNHLILLITYIDILLEATDQIYRVLYKEKKQMPLPDDTVFLNRPELYKSLDDRQYFKEIRALLSAHPINLNEPNSKEKLLSIIRLQISRAIIKLKEDTIFHLVYGQRLDMMRILFIFRLELTN